MSEQDEVRQKERIAIYWQAFNAMLEERRDLYLEYAKVEGELLVVRVKIFNAASQARKLYIDAGEPVPDEIARLIREYHPEICTHRKRAAAKARPQ